MGVCDVVSDSDGVALGGAPTDALVDGFTTGSVVLGDCVGEIVVLTDAVAVPEFVGLCEGVVDVDSALVPDRDGVSLDDAPMLSVVVDEGNCEGVAELVVVTGGVEEPESVDDGEGVADSDCVGVIVTLAEFATVPLVVAVDVGEYVCDAVPDPVAVFVAEGVPLCEAVTEDDCVCVGVSEGDGVRDGVTDGVGDALGTQVRTRIAPLLESET